MPCARVDCRAGEEGWNVVKLGELGGGYPNDVAVEGDLACVAAAGQMLVLDVSTPAAPRLLGTYDTPGQALGVVVADHHAYVVDSDRTRQFGGTLSILDIGDPTTPRLAHAMESGGIRVAGGRAYHLADSLRIFDVSTPATPIQLGSTGDVGFQPVDFSVVGSTVYVLSRLGGFRIIDAGDPAHPIEIGHHDPGHVISAGDVEGDRACIATGRYLDWGLIDLKLRLLDVADPAAPIELAVIDLPGLGIRVAVRDGLVYVAMADRFLVYEAETGRTWTRSVSGWPGGMAIGAERLFVASGREGVRVLSLERLDPVGRFETWGGRHGIQVAGDLAYIAAGDLEILDVGDPGRLRRVGTYRRPEPDQGGYSDVCQDGDLVLALGSRLSGQVYHGMCDIIHVHEPARPHRIPFSLGGLTDAHAAIDGDHAYIAGGYLRIYDISNPDAPVERSVSSLPPGSPSDHVRDVDVSGDLAFLAIDSGLAVLDVSDPAHAVEIGDLLTSSDATRVHCSGDRVLLATKAPGVLIIDVSDPTDPVALGEYEAPARVANVVGADHLAYVAAAGAGLRVIDVTDAAQPVEVGYYETAGSVGGLALAGDRIYLTDFDVGLYVLRRQATAAELVSFELRLDGDDVEARWAFEREGGTLHYFLLRSATPALADATPLSDLPIPAGQGEYVHRDPAAPGWSWYWVEETTLEGEPKLHGPRSVYTEQSLYQSPRTFMIRSAPNPSGGRTEFRISLPVPGRVDLKVYDVSGRLVRDVIRAATMGPGEHRVSWDGVSDAGSPVGAGIYFYRLRSGDGAQVEGKLQIIR